MALVVFTGGARSGKSGAATRLVTSRVGDSGATIVVFGRETEDEEFAERIARHRRGATDALDRPWRCWTHRVGPLVYPRARRF